MGFNSGFKELIDVMRGAWWWFVWNETCSTVLFDIKVLCYTVYFFCLWYWKTQRDVPEYNSSNSTLQPAPDVPTPKERAECTESRDFRRKHTQSCCKYAVHRSGSENKTSKIMKCKPRKGMISLPAAKSWGLEVYFCILQLCLSAVAFRPFI